MPDPHANFAVSTVATTPSPATSGTSLVVAAGEGTRFPDPGSVGAYNCTIWPAGALPTPANAEIVRVTAKSTDTLTITRTQESSSARTVIVGDQIAMTITKKTLTDAEERYTRIRLFAALGATVVNVNSTAYIVPTDAFLFRWDFDFFNFTHFMIDLAGLSNAAGQTVTGQLTLYGSPTNPISAAGDDTGAVPNSQAVYNSGWVARSDVLTGVQNLAVAWKGSNSTVDLSVVYLDVHLKIDN